MLNKLIHEGRLVRVKENLNIIESSSVGVMDTMLEHQGLVYRIDKIEGRIVKLSDGFWYDIDMVDMLYTAKEVMSQIEDGETFINIKSNRGLTHISQENGCLYFNTSMVSDAFNVPDTSSFMKLEKSREVYQVEHSEGGTLYDFYSEDNLKEEEFVVCDTVMGLSYGKVVNILKDQPSNLGHKYCRRA